jgi:hypothetical protein
MGATRTADAPFLRKYKEAKDFTHPVRHPRQDGNYHLGWVREEIPPSSHS